MKINTLLDTVNPSTFISDYLQICGVKDVKTYMNPTEDLFESPWQYPNIESAVDRLKQAVDNHERIGVLVDSDCDGQLSATIIVQLLECIGIEPTLFFHVGKQHGLRASKDEDICAQIIENNIQLLIIPDAGSNDIEEHKELKQHKCDCIVLDHHEVIEESQNAIIVNHHMIKGLNIALSGTGVAEKFALAYSEKYHIDIPDFKDLVAVSIISDVCDLSSIENRTYVLYGLNNLTNPMIKLMDEKLNRKGNTPEGFAWGIIPPINALCRGNNQEHKKLFFNALIGKGDMEEGIAVVRKAHREQTNTVKSMFEEIEPTLDLSHKAIIGFAEADNKEYVGLVANKICGKYKKPTILLREADVTNWSGSLRSPFSLLEEINETGFATCQGHSSAAGVFIKKSNLPKLEKWFDNLNADIDPYIDVVGELKPSQITIDLCQSVLENKILWGHGVPEPLFYFKIQIDSFNVHVFQKRTTTIRLDVDGISFIKFFATQDDIDKLSQETDYVIEMVCKLGINEYNDFTSPQCVIEQYEIVEEVNNANEFNWEDLFN